MRITALILVHLATLCEYASITPLAELGKVRRWRFYAVAARRFCNLSECGAILGVGRVIRSTTSASRSSGSLFMTYSSTNQRGLSGMSE